MSWDDGLEAAERPGYAETMYAAADHQRKAGREARPYSKEAQLGAGRPKRTARKRATRAEWRELHGAKNGACRICGAPGPSNLHHIVPRSLGGGDTFHNLAPLCGSGTTGCHGLVESRNAHALKAFASTLTDGEYAYAIERLGEGAMTRLFGVMPDTATASCARSEKEGL